MAKILVADDYEDSLKATSIILKKDKHQIITAQDGKEALKKANLENPDVILLDLKTPAKKGFDICRQLEANPFMAHIPVIFLTAKLKDSQAMLKGLDIVHDFISKPFKSSELQARIRVMVRLKSQMDQLSQKNIDLEALNQTLEQKNQDLLFAQKALEEMAIRDSLTTLYNRRYFSGRLEEEFLRNRRSKQPIGIVMLDIDHFKKVNDTYGHLCGDSVLVQYADILKKNVRQHDIVARYGGEEFVIGLIGQTMREAYATGERIRVDVEQYLFRHEKIELQITCSAGIASYPEICEENPSLSALLQEGDAALYEAKAQGRNLVVCASSSPPQSPLI